MMKSTGFLFQISVAGATDIGSMRSTNQDRIILDNEHGFFGVSDGMGGLRFGADAATYVSVSLPELVGICLKESIPSDPVDVMAERLRLVTCMLSDQLYKRGNAHGRFNYGATLAGVWLCRDQAVFVGLGDSRGYLLSRNSEVLEQVTQDMNVAGILVRNGQMTKEEAARSPASSQLTAFVGMEEPATPDIFIRPLRPGDLLLLCSDGLYGMVPEAEIAGILQTEHDLQQACRALIEAANTHGGRDNISAVIIRVE